MEIHEYIESKILELDDQGGPVLKKDYVRKILMHLKHNLGTPAKRKRHVDVLRKKDIVYIETFGGKHYVLIVNAGKDKCQGLIMSSQNKDYVLKEITSDRFFQGSYVTTSLISVSSEVGKQNFVRKFESEREFKNIEKRFKKLYGELFSERGE